MGLPPAPSSVSQSSTCHHQGYKSGRGRETTTAQKPKTSVPPRNDHCPACRHRSLPPPPPRSESRKEQPTDLKTPAAPARSHDRPAPPWPRRAEAKPFKVCSAAPPVDRTPAEETGGGEETRAGAGSGAGQARPRGPPQAAPHAPRKRRAGGRAGRPGSLYGLRHLPPSPPAPGPAAAYNAAHYRRRDPRPGGSGAHTHTDTAGPPAGRPGRGPGLCSARRGGGHGTGQDRRSPQGA